MNPFVPKGTIFRDEEEKLQLESRNGILQFKFVIYTAENWGSRKFAADLLMEAQRLAVNQIYRCAGYFRDGPVKLDGATMSRRHMIRFHPWWMKCAAMLMTIGLRLRFISPPI